jgi:predicted DNA-binding transcriptional regulator AlpA
MAQLVTIDELAAQLQISVKSIYNMRSAAPAAALPPAIKVGKYLRWRQEAIDGWLDAQSPASNVTPINQPRSKSA